MSIENGSIAKQGRREAWYRSTGSSGAVASGPKDRYKQLNP